MDRRTVKKYFGDKLSKDQVKEITAIINGNGSIDSILEKINSILKGFGVEGIRGSYWIDSYYQDINLLYVNMGDSYDLTIMYDTYLDKFFCGSWGDYVESKPKRFEEL